MAINSYTDLVAAITAWLDGSPLGGREGDFITLAEDEINALLGAAVREGRAVRPMITRSDIVIDAEYVALPSGGPQIIMPLAIEVTSLGRPWQIDYIAPEQLAAMRFGVAGARESVDVLISGNPPRFYSLVGDELRFFAPPEGASFTAAFTRYEAVPPLSDDNPSNWLLTSHRNVYLYGALAQAELFGWNDAGTGKFAALFANAMTGLIDRYPVPADHTPLRSEIGTLGGRHGMTLDSFMGGTI